MAKRVSMFLGAVGVASLGQQLVGVAAGMAGWGLIMFDVCVIEPAKVYWGVTARITSL